MTEPWCLSAERAFSIPNGAGEFLIAAPASDDVSLQQVGLTAVTKSELTVESIISNMMTKAVVSALNSKGK